MGKPVELREISNEEGNRLLRMVRRGAGNVVTWPTIAMAINDTVTYTVEFEAPATGSLTNIAAATARPVRLAVDGTSGQAHESPRG